MNNRAESSGDFLPSSPPGEKATASQDQAGKASADDRTRHCQEAANLASWERIGVDVKICSSFQKGRDEYWLGRCG